MRNHTLGRGGRVSLAVVVAIAVSICGMALAQGNQVPKLRPSAGMPAGPELVQKILDANSFWLHPPVAKEDYTFQMQQIGGRQEQWSATVEFTAPDQVIVQAVGDRNYTGKVDDSYDRQNSAYPPHRTTLLQGTTFWGPMNALSAAPEDHKLEVVGEDTVDGRAAQVLQLIPTWKPSDKYVRRRAMHPKYMYDFTPTEKTIDGRQKVVMEIKCPGQKGPGWADIEAAYKANQSRIKWGGMVITAEKRNFRGEDRPVIVINRDPDFHGKSPIKLTMFSNGVNNMTLKLTLGEGQPVLDQAELGKLTAQLKPYLPMFVGCGIWGMWYGYIGSGAEVDQIYVDKATGQLLREEGFAHGKCSFVVEYSDFVNVAGQRQVPRHVAITMLGQGQNMPWIFDLKFTTLGGKCWLLDTLEESQGSYGPMAKAQTSEATATALAQPQAPAQQ